MKTSELIEYVAPGKEWVLQGDPQNELQYSEALTWISKGTPPTWKALKIAEPEAEYAAQYDAVSAARLVAYQKDSDPIFFQWQRGEKTEQEWRDAVTAVNDANPYPVKPSATK